MLLLYSYSHNRAQSILLYSLSQSLCTECGKKLSDAEMSMDKFESVSRKIPTLKRQLDSIQVDNVLYIHVQ